MSKNKIIDRGLNRFRPIVEQNDDLQVTRFFDLCKSCGECLERCPVKAISWDEQELGLLGEPAIKIDLGTCIGCGLCEQICPDAAIKIINKKTERAMKKIQSKSEN